MSQEVIVSLSIIIGIAALLSIIFRAIRQPTIIAYLIAGVLVGPLALGIIGTEQASLIQTFAHLGVALLLFIVGLSLDFRVLKEVGVVSVFAGIGEILLAGGIGILIAIGLGFNSTSSFYLGAALAFSSTVLVVKILSDKKELDTLHGRIALGILIIEDIVAAIVLMAIPILKNSVLTTIFLSLGKIMLLILLVFVLSFTLFNRFMRYLAKSQEVLFLSGIAWALVLASLFNYLGFSLEIGALIAGMSLASTNYKLELSGKIKPIRDFFMVLFFVFFGSQLIGSISSAIVKNAIIFSVFILVGKPLIVMSFLRLFGYKKRTNFLAGASLAQISEFSLIIILLGFTLGHISQDLMSLVVLISLITICLSSYSIYYSNWIFAKLQKLLNLFDGKKEIGSVSNEKEFDIILFGYHRIGRSLLKTLQSKSVKCLVADYNPSVIYSLAKHGVPCVYGDASDNDFLSELKLKNARLVISTIPDRASNLAIITMLKDIKSNAVFVATAEQVHDALELYTAGVDYVILPHLLGGKYISEFIKKHETNRAAYEKLGMQHFKELRKI